MIRFEVELGDNAYRRLNDWADHIGQSFDTYVQMVLINHTEQEEGFTRFVENDSEEEVTVPEETVVDVPITLDPEE